MATDKDKRPNTLKNLEPFKDLYTTYLTHFNSKAINSYNPTIPARIKMLNANPKIPYIGLSTIGADISDLDFNKNASELPPVRKLKALWNNENEFDLYLKNEILRIQEKLDKLVQKEVKKKEDLDNIEKYNNDINNFKIDLENIELIKNKYGLNSDFYTKINSETVVCNKLTPYLKQLLVFSESENDYISFSPLFPVGINNKIIECFSERKKFVTNKKNGEVIEKEKYFKSIQAAIGGNQPQNISSLPANILNFRLFTPAPKFIDQYYSDIWKYVNKGIKIHLNKDDLKLLKLAIAQYEQFPKQENEKILKTKIVFIVDKIINNVIKIKEILNETIKKEFYEELVLITENKKTSDLYKFINSEISRDYLWNGLLNKINKNDIKYQYLLNDKKEYSEDIANNIITEIFSYSRKYKININISYEMNKKIKNIIKECL